MIIRFGAMHISKSYLFYLKENKNVPHYVIEADKDVREPTNQQATYLLTDEYLFIQSLLENNVQLETSRWTTKWNTYNELAQKILTKTGLNDLTEGNKIKQEIKYKKKQKNTTKQRK